MKLATLIDCQEAQLLAAAFPLYFERQAGIRGAQHGRELGSCGHELLAASPDGGLACADLAQLPQLGWIAPVRSCTALHAALVDSSCVSMMLKVSMPTTP